mmetsp:Transcript_70643/g.229008  ORF Transcript_70643/g.229008 Transcript_70643/m.229008 type:complete len:209 (-) Transcript_70643:2020-2646(-)
MVATSVAQKINADPGDTREDARGIRAKSRKRFSSQTQRPVGSKAKAICPTARPNAAHTRRSTFMSGRCTCGGGWPSTEKTVIPPRLPERLHARGAMSRAAAGASEPRSKPSSGKRLPRARWQAAATAWSRSKSSSCPAAPGASRRARRSRPSSTADPVPAAPSPEPADEARPPRRLEASKVCCRRSRDKVSRTLRTTVKKCLMASLLP